MKLVMKLSGPALLLGCFWAADYIHRVIPGENWVMRVLAVPVVIGMALFAFWLIGRYITRSFLNGGDERQEEETASG